MFFPAEDQLIGDAVVVRKNTKNRAIRAVSFLLWTTATALYIIAMDSNYWVTSRAQYYGVSERCNVFVCTAVPFSFSEKTHVTIPRGQIIFAACATFTALKYPEENNFLQVLFQDIQDKTFHYSFYFGWISGLLFIISGICSIIAGNSYK